MIGFLSGKTKSASRFFEFFFLVFGESSRRCLELSKETLTTKEGESAFLLFSISRKENIFFENENILLGWKKETKRRKKSIVVFKEEKIFSLCSLSRLEGGRASSPPIVVVVIEQRRAAVLKYRAQEKKYTTARAQGAKNLDIWWREEVLLRVLSIERSVFARAFPPYNFPSDGIVSLVSSFDNFSSFLVGNLPF